jgi:hypothetical protein
MSAGYEGTLCTATVQKRLYSQMASSNCVGQGVPLSAAASSGTSRTNFSCSELEVIGSLCLLQSGSSCTIRAVVGNGWTETGKCDRRFMRCFIAHSKMMSLTTRRSIMGSLGGANSCRARKLLLYYVIPVDSKGF